MGARLSVDKEKLKDLRKTAETHNPAHLFLNCLISRCAIDDDSQTIELAEQENVVKGSRYVRPGEIEK